MSVAKTLLPTSHLIQHVCTGKQALSKAARIAVEESTARVVDSLDLDAATAEALPGDNRWDYLLGLGGRKANVIAVEIHPATAKEAKKVIAKQKAAITLLGSHLKAGGSLPDRWYWIASGRSALPRTTSAYRELVKAGIHFSGARLIL